MKSGVYWDWDLKKYNDTVQVKVYELTNKTAKEIYELCIKLSPVDTGAYRASWSMTEGYEANVFVGRQPRGQYPLPAPSTPVISSKFYRQIYISNGSPYADKIEKGWSPKAPNGVLKMALKLRSKI